MSGGSAGLAIAGIILAFVFGATAAYNLKILILASPALKITDEGIHDHTTYMSGGLIKWTEIESIGIGELQGWKFLIIHTYDRDLMTKRFSGLKKMLVGYNRGLSDAQAHIPYRLLACDPVKLTEDVLERFERYGDYPQGA